MAELVSQKNEEIVAENAETDNNKKKNDDDDDGSNNNDTNNANNKRRHRRNLSLQVGAMLINEKDEATKLGIDLTYDQEKAKAEALLAEEKKKIAELESESDGKTSDDNDSDSSGVITSSSTLPPINQFGTTKKANPFQSSPNTANIHDDDDDDDDDSDDDNDYDDGEDGNGTNTSNAPVLSRDSLFGSMWSRDSFFPPSSVDALLDDPKCTLENILLEDEVFQELRRTNAKLITFLLKPENVLKVIDYTIIMDDDEKRRSKANTDFEGKVRTEEEEEEQEQAEENTLDPTTLLRYSLVSCAILCSDVGSINDIMFESINFNDTKKNNDNAEVSKENNTQGKDIILLDRLFSILEADEIPIRVATNIEKVIETLLLSKRTKLLEWLNGYKKYLPLFMKHISMNSISEIYRKILHFADGGDINSNGDGAGINLWCDNVEEEEENNTASLDEGKKSSSLEGDNYKNNNSNEHPIIENLINKLASPGLNSTGYLNVMETIIDMIVRSTGEMTFMMMQRGEEPKNMPTRLMMGLDTYAQATSLIRGCIDGWKFEDTAGTRARLQVLSKWLIWVSHTMSMLNQEINKNKREDMESDDATTTYDDDDEIKMLPPLIKALLEEIPFFCTALEFKDEELVPVLATYGMSNGKIGVVRLELVDLLCTLSCVPHTNVAKVIAENGFMGKCFDIFLKFEWCNIAHSKITSAIVTMLNDINNVKCTDVYASFFLKYDLIKHVLDAYITNDEKKKTRHYESGYMGHLHVIAASIMEAAKVLKSMNVKPGNNTAAEIILQAIENNNESNEWSVFVDVKLQQVIRTQTKALGNDNNYKAVASPKLSPKEFVAFVKDDLDLLESSETLDAHSSGSKEESTESDEGKISTGKTSPTIRELVLDNLNFDEGEENNDDENDTAGNSKEE